MLVTHRGHATRWVAFAPVSTDPLARLASLEGVPSAYAAARDGIDVDAARPRPAPYVARDDRREPAPRRPCERGAGGLGVVAGRGPRRAPATRSRRTPSGCRPSCSSLAPALTRSPLQALARIHALAAGDPAGRTGAAGRATRDAADRLRGVGDLLTATTDGTGAAGGGRRARRARDRGAVRLPQRDRGARGGAAGAGVARRRREVAGGARRPGTWRCARRTSRTCAATATAAPAGVHAWLLYAAEAYAAGAEASPLRRARSERTWPHANGTRLSRCDGPGAAADT